MAITLAADGFHDFTGNGTTDRTIYVSNAGNDGNSGLTPAQAKATPQGGFSLWRAGTGDRILFRNGDTWTNPSVPRTLGFSGRSSTEPLVIGRYGVAGDPLHDDAAPRPIWNLTNGQRLFEPGTNSVTNNIAFTGIHVKGNGGGIFWYSWDPMRGSNLFFEDMFFDNLEVALDFVQNISPAGANSYNDCTIYRCIFRNMTSQGCYTASMGGTWTIEDNRFIHCGAPGAQTHHWYMDTARVPGFRAKWFRNGFLGEANRSLSGIKSRPPCDVEENFTFRVPIGIDIGDALDGGQNPLDPLNTICRYNVSMEAVTGSGVASAFCFEFIGLNDSVTQSIIQHNLALRNSGAFTAGFRFDDRGNTPRYILFADNVSYNGGHIDFHHNGHTAPISLLRNKVCITAAQGGGSNDGKIIQHRFGVGSSSIWTATDNEFFSYDPQSSWYDAGDDALANITAWISAIGATGTLIRANSGAFGFSDVTRGPKSYLVTLGISVADEDAAYNYFVTNWALQRRGSWNPDLEMRPLLNHIRPGFNLPTVGSITPPNTAPTANAGPDQLSVPGTQTGIGSVTLNGTASTDSDGSIVVYAWTENSTPLATGATPTISLPLGQHTITLTVTDNGSATGTDTVTINILPPAPINLSATRQFQQLSLTWNSIPNVTGYDVRYGTTSGSGTATPTTGNTFSTPNNLTPGTTYFIGVRSKTATSTSAYTEIQAVPLGRPVANAGPDQLVDDVDRNGSQAVTLNGSLSTTPNSGGTLTTFTWTGPTTVTGVTPSVTPPVGVSVYSLVVTDSFGIQSLADTVSVSVVPGVPTNFTVTNSIDAFTIGWAPIPGATSYTIQYGTTPSYGASGSPFNTTSTSAIVSVPGQGGTTFHWTVRANTGGLSSSYASDQLANPSAPINQPPISNAGVDQTDTDTNRDGSESITFNGSSSAGQGGATISSYAWWFDGGLLATGATPTASLPVGVNRVDLIVTDNHSLTSTDFLIVTVYPGAPATLTLSMASDLRFTGTWTAVPGATAYRVNITNNSTYNITYDTTELSFGVSVPSSGSYTVTITALIAGLPSTVSATDSILVPAPEGNQSPIANAGPDQTIPGPVGGGSVGVTLDGSLSYDPDNQDPFDAGLTYSWRIGSPSGFEIGTNPTCNVLMSALISGSISTTFYLIVTDADNATSTDSVTITLVTPSRRALLLPRLFKFISHVLFNRSR